MLGGAAPPTLAAPAPPTRFGYTTLPQLSCGHGHAVRDSFLALTERPFRCTHRDPTTGRECGDIIWIMSAAGGAVVFAAVVTILQFRYMKHIADEGGVLAVLDWLGAPRFHPM